MRFRVILFSVWLGTGLLSATSAGGDEFPELHNSQREDVPLTTPDEAVELLALPTGFQATLFAGEPDVRQPIAATIDQRGRLWVAENFTYAESNFDLDMRDRLVILTDHDHDGRADERQVFWDEGKLLTSVEVGFGGVWVLCAPHLLFIPDRDGDDVPDGEPIVELDGWVIGEVGHNIVNGLRWGHDGWLYGTHGILDTSHPGRPGTPLDQRPAINCGVWRYHPTRKVFEVVAHGTTNPWGIDFDEHGQMFIINTVIGHLWHVMPGAHFRRMYGSHFNPHIYDVIEQTADHFHWDTREHWTDIRTLGVTDTTDAEGGGHAHCGLMIYLADNWPEELRGGVFTLNEHGRRINHDVLGRAGCGYVARHRPDLLRSNDHWFRGIDLFYGPDGGVFVLDWSDIGECHEADGIHRTSGRIYKLTYGEPPAPRYGDLGQLSHKELVALQLEQNEWYVRQARHLLQQRAAAGADSESIRPALLEIFDNDNDIRHKLRALWVMYSTGLTDAAWLLQQTHHTNEHIRAWAVRLLADSAEMISPAVIDQFAKLAERDESGLVRLHLASAMGRLPVADRLRVAEALLSHSEDQNDLAQPLLIWQAIEPAVVELPKDGIRVARTTQIPAVRGYIVRRLAHALDTHPAAFATLLAWIREEQHADTLVALLSSIRTALEGRRSAQAPAEWEAARAQLAQHQSAEIRALARELGVILQDGKSLASLRHIMADRNEAVELRQRALRSFTAARPDDLFAIARPLIGDGDVAVEAIRAVAASGTPQAGEVLSAALSEQDGPARDEIIAALASRPDWAHRLVDGLEQARVSRDALNASHAMQLRSLRDKQLLERLSKVWGDVRDTPEDRLNEMERWRKIIAGQSVHDGNLKNGLAVFTRSCASCHMLHGKGGNIGPDLTGGQRSNLSYWLQNIIDPSAMVAEGFRVSMVVLADGRVLTGVEVGKTDHTLTVQTAQERITLDQDDIEEVINSQESLMPTGILKTLTVEEVIDLFAYLRS